jgi:hypothetical protein
MDLFFYMPEPKVTYNGRSATAPQGPAPAPVQQEKKASRKTSTKKK